MLDQSRREEAARKLELALEMFAVGESLMRQKLRRSHPDASEAEIKNVFKNVSSLRIRGEFADADDSACLDNVYFGVE